MWSVLRRALKVVAAMGVSGFFARVSAASAVRTRATECFDMPVLPEPVPLDQLQLRVGVMAHVFYPDLIEEFALALEKIPLRFTLLVSVMDAPAEELAQQRFAALPNLQALIIRQVANRGRDIAPLLVTFRQEILSLDVIGHIHSKKSLYTGSEQEQWRHYLLHSLLGTPERIAWILGMFQADPALGLVYPESYHGVPLWAHTWLSNGPACDALASQLGIALDHQRYIDFPAGSMFWARVDALRPLYALNLPLQAFPEEQGQIDGTLQHAVERMFGVVTRHQGFRLGILPADGQLALPVEGERNVGEALQSPLADRLQLAALNAKQLTFDVFDTLVTRAFLTPSAARAHLAWRLERTLGVAGFSQHREDAEQQLRHQLQRDPTLPEIHALLARRLAIADVDAGLLADAERNHERALLRPRRGVLAALQQAGLSRVSVLSDMYLSTPDMEQVLPHDVLAHIERWWISCETGRRKDSLAGWQQMAAEHGMETARWLHVGDNEHADIQLPQLAGLLAPVHVLRPSALLDVIPGLRPLRHRQGSDAPWPAQLWRGLVANRFAERADTAPQALLGRPQLDAGMLGYCVVGPLVLDFLLYVIASAQRRGVQHLLFLSREGHLLQQGFSRLQSSHVGAATLTGTYFLASRRATLLPSLSSGDDLRAAFQGVFNGSLEQLLHARLGQEAADCVRHALPSVLARDIFLPEMTDEVTAWLQPVVPALLSLASQQRTAYRDYWARTVGQQTAMVVDIGYAGSIQRQLSRLLARPLGGAYMALREGARALPATDWAEARYADARQSASGAMPTSTILDNDLLLEALLTAPQGQFNGFDPRSGAARFGAIELSPEGIDVLEAVHRGALSFIDDVAAAIGEDISALELDLEGVQVPLACLGQGRWDADATLTLLATEDSFTGRGRVSAVGNEA